ncbi:MAG: MFS transporter [Candidatus Nezhaarchaeales archaeon]
MLLPIYCSLFLITLGIGAYNPFIPLYAQMLGASYYDLGLIGVAFSFPYLVLPVFTGALSDRFGRRLLFLCGVSCSAIIALLFIFASNVLHIIVIRLFSGVAYAFMWPIAEAIITDLTTAEERIKAMGRYSFSWSLGFLVGPFIGGSILEGLGFNTLFTVSFSLGLMAVVTASYGLLERYEAKYSEFTVEQPSWATPMKELTPIYFVIVTYSITLGLIYAIFPAYAVSINVTFFEVGVLFTILGAVRTITFLGSEVISRMGTNRSIGLALIAQTVSMLGIAYLKGFTFLAVLMVLAGFAMGIFSPLTLSVASRSAPKERVGTMIGFVEAFFGLGFTVGPFIGGLTAELFGATSPYVIVAILSGLTIIPIGLWREAKPAR